MNKKILYVLIIFCFFLLSAPLIFAQEQSEDLTFRTLSVDWYQHAGAGVKLQYRSFKNEPVILYLPMSFYRKFYRFVESPKYVGDLQGLPVLLVHLEGSEVAFIGIYTRYMQADGIPSEFNQEDFDNFAAAEEKGTVELIFH